jgi:hypothetical protein
MKTGEIVEGKFADHKSGKVILESGLQIPLDKVSAMSIRKLRATQVANTEIPKIVWRKDK